MGRYVLTFLAVAIGVGFVGGVVTLTDTIDRTFDDLFRGLGAGTDVAVRGVGQFELSAQMGGGVQRPRIDASLVERVAAVPGVASAEGFVQGYVRPIGPDGRPFGNPNFGAPTVGTNWSADEQLNPFQIAAGRPPDGPGELVLDKRTADETGYRIGDTVSFQSGIGVSQATLVGVARFGTADSPAGLSVTLFDRDTAQGLLAEPGKIDSVYAVAEPGTSQVALRNAVRDALAGTEVEVVTGRKLVADAQANSQDTFTGLRTFLLVFALISVLVGTFVIYTSFSFIVAQRQRQVALLRALGASRAQVLGSVVIESLVVGVLASLVGYALGLALATALGRAFVPGSEPVILPRSVAVALTVGVVVTALSAFFPAARASRVPPVAAMRDVAIDTSHRSLPRLLLGGLLVAGGAVALGAGVAGRAVGDLSPLKVSGTGMVLLFVSLIVLGPVTSRPASLALGLPLPAIRGVVGRLAQQNAARNPKRTASTAAALMIGLGIVSLFLVINASLRASLDDMVDNRFRGDVVIDSGTGITGGGLPGGIAEEVASLPEVSSASGIRFGFASIDGRTEGIGGLDPATAFDLFDVAVVEGDVADLDADGIGVFDDRARSEGWRVGDTLPVTFGETGTQELTIAALIDSRDLTGTYVMSTDAFDRYVPEAGDSQIWIRLTSGTGIDDARAALEPLIAPFPSAEMQDLDEFKDAVKSQYDVILVLVNALLLLTILIAMIGIVNTLILSVVERTREIGLTRAVGATRGQVRSSIRWEALLIATIGLTAALALGIFFGWVLVRALADQGFRVFALPTLQLAAFAAATGLLTLAAAVVPAAWAGRRRILAAIADR
ncbi:MAG TPA: FtsX-like permease family protein [Acidimicrobiales bacterium]|nr:FtsX-like permease family protein [Acidimicrobiales bacterium]